MGARERRGPKNAAAEMLARLGQEAQRLAVLLGLLDQPLDLLVVAAYPANEGADDLRKTDRRQSRSVRWRILR